MSFRLNLNKFGGGVLICSREYIPCKKLTKRYLSGNIDGSFVKINLRKLTGYCLEPTFP